MDPIQTNSEGTTPKGGIGGSIGIIIIILVIALGAFFFFMSKENSMKTGDTTMEQSSENASLEQELDASVSTDIDADMKALDGEFGN